MNAADEERLRRNDESRAHADHHREPWSSDEVDFLMEFWPEHEDAAEEAEVAEALGRTIEACRQRRYEIKWGRAHVLHRKTTTTTTTTETYVGAFDDPEDRWWSSEFYTNE